MGELRDAFDQTVEASKVIQQVDAAAVEAGRTIADRIDEAVAYEEGPNLTKALYLTPHLMNILRELLATPASRNAAGINEPAGPGGKLASIREHAEKRTKSA